MAEPMAAHFHRAVVLDGVDFERARHEFPPTTQQHRDAFEAAKSAVREFADALKVKDAKVDVERLEHFRLTPSAI